MSRRPRTNAEATVLATGDVVFDPGGEWPTTPGIVTDISASKLGGTVVWANGGRQGGRWSAMDLVHREPRLRVPVPTGALGNRGWNREQAVRAALRRAGVEWTEEER